MKTVLWQDWNWLGSMWDNGIVLDNHQRNVSSQTLGWGMPRVFYGYRELRVIPIAEVMSYWADMQRSHLSYFKRYSTDSVSLNHSAVLTRGNRGVDSNNDKSRQFYAMLLKPFLAFCSFIIGCLAFCYGWM